MRPASFRSAFSRSLLFLALAVSAGGAMAILDRIIVVVIDLLNGRLRSGVRHGGGRLRLGHVRRLELLRRRRPRLRAHVLNLRLHAHARTRVNVVPRGTDRLDKSVYPRRSRRKNLGRKGWERTSPKMM